jgi:hypothetical protein
MLREANSPRIAPGDSAWYWRMVCLLVDRTGTSGLGDVETACGLMRGCPEVVDLLGDIRGGRVLRGMHPSSLAIAMWPPLHGLGIDDAAMMARYPREVLFRSATVGSRPTAHDIRPLA